MKQPFRDEAAIHSQRLDCSVIGLINFKKKADPSAIKDGIRRQSITH